MALRYIAVSAAGTPAESDNALTTLSSAVQDAIDAAVTANGEAGSNADVTTELGAIETALDAVDASVPTGGVVVSLDTEAVTSLDHLKRLLDAAYKHVEASNLLS